MRNSLNYILYHKVMPILRRYVFKPLNYLVSKQSNIWVFHSKPVGYRDNARAVYDYVIEHCPEIQAVWLVDKPEEAIPMRSRGVRTFHWRSLQGLSWLLRAGIIFTTHFGFNDLKVHGQRAVALWHGIPIKSIGFTQLTSVDKDIHVHYETAARQVDQWIATSPLTQLVVSSSFGLRASQIPITGQPRTDWLFRDSEDIIKRLSEHININSHERLILWAPTFRKPRTRLRNDGMDLSLLLSSSKFLSQLDQLLSSTQSQLIIKTHQFEDWDVTSMQGHNRIHLLSDAELGEAGLELHEVLAGTDILITDYSSIFIDFLLLDRPLVFFVPDLDTYQARRGFLLEPFDYWTPGPKARCTHDLIQVLTTILNGDDSYQKQRTELKRAYHTYTDGRSSERLVAWLKSSEGLL